MKKLIVSLLVLGCLFTFHACKDNESTGTYDSTLYGSDYGEETIGYRSGKPKSESNGKEDGMDPSNGDKGSPEAGGEGSDGDYGYTGDVADTDSDGNPGDTGITDETNDNSSEPSDSDSVVVPETDQNTDVDADAVVEVPDTDVNNDSGEVDEDSQTDEDQPALSLRSEIKVKENPFKLTDDDPATTFALDVDSASFSIVRGALMDGVLPKPETVRIEEMVNYFKYYYRKPKADEPFSVYTEYGICPWNPAHKLVMIGVRGHEVKMDKAPPANIVFLVDVSGSMSDQDKLPLLKKGLRMMLKQLRDVDTISIVAYAGEDKVVLEGAKGTQKEMIKEAIDNLDSGGSTAGEAGIRRAYQIAKKYYNPEGLNRVILATDGDFNVGISDEDELKKFISEKRDTGVFLSVYGFGDAWGDQDAVDNTMETLADNGNGVYFFIDGKEEARRAFGYTFTDSLFTVAKDVKLQVQFNPALVKAHRLVGYENRMLNNSDFDNDNVDGGELGSGQDMTAFFEIIPASSDEVVAGDSEEDDSDAVVAGDSEEDDSDAVVAGDSEEDDSDAVVAGDSEEDDSDTVATEPVTGDNLIEVRIRYKEPNEDNSSLMKRPVNITELRKIPSMKYLFASGVAHFGLLLRGSEFTKEGNLNEIHEYIKSTIPADTEGAIEDMMNLIGKADSIKK